MLSSLYRGRMRYDKKDVECSKRLLRKETAMDSCNQITQTVDASPAEFDATAATICLQHSSTIFGCFAIDFVGVSWKETYNFAVESYYDSRTEISCPKHPPAHPPYLA